MQPRKFWTLALLAGSIWGAWAAPGVPAAAASAPAIQAAPTSRIAQVKLYPGSATVQRVASLPAGARSYRFNCLPASLDAASLQVSADAGVRIGETSVQVQERDISTDCHNALDERLRQAQDQVAAARADSSALELAHSYLKTVATAAPAQAATPAPAQIAPTGEALRKQTQDTLVRLHLAQRQLEQAELALKAVQAERARSASVHARVSQVTVTLATERAAELRLSYQVRGPSWSPSYRALLDSGSAKVQLERLALVAQNTGEDWAGVQLTLSTGQPQRNTSGALPRPWRLDVAAPEPMLMAAPAPAPTMARSSKALAAEAAAVADEEPLPSFEVSVQDGAFATEFALPQRIHLPSGGTRITLSLGQQELPAKLLARSTPALEEAAYLVAQLAAPSGVWPAAPLALYRDGAYVGQGRLEVAQLERLGLSFGRDERVLVRAEPVREHRASAGLMGGSTERQWQRAYSVHNRHGSAITVQVLDAAPISENAQISVQSSYQPQPTQLAWNEQPGSIVWQQELAANASARFEAAHTIRHAKDVPVREQR